MKPSISVIVAVYNHFEWLRLILDALRMQTNRDFEVVIADDGSSEETVARIREYIAAHPELRIVHSWQEDKGWRKDMSLNEAVRKSQGDYLVFIDGDCVPHPKFVEDHYRLRKHGVATGGRRMQMNKALNEMAEGMTELPADFFGKLRRKVMSRIFKTPVGETFAQLKRMIHFPIIGGKALMASNDGILGCNFGIYKEDLLSVNGFDERYVDPGTGEDTDLDIRLANAGIGHRKVSHYALMAHRDHVSAVYPSPNNEKLLRAAIEEGLTWTPAGIKK